MVDRFENERQDDLSGFSRFSGAGLASFFIIKPAIKIAFYAKRSISLAISTVRALLVGWNCKLLTYIGKLICAKDRYPQTFDKAVENIEFCKSLLRDYSAIVKEITLTHRNIFRSYGNTCN